MFILLYKIRMCSITIKQETYLIILITVYFKNFSKTWFFKVVTLCLYKFNIILCSYCIRNNFSSNYFNNQSYFINLSIKIEK